MKEKLYIQDFKTPMGDMLLGVFNNHLVLADWKYRKMRKQIDTRLQTLLNAVYTQQSHPLFSNVEDELNQYFAKERTQFTIPITLAGTDFQKKVWTALGTIKYGNTESYLSLSEKLHNPKAIRAVATANGANALSIIVPCHRIIGKNGELVGYAGGLPAKKKLLLLENAIDTTQLSLF